MSTTVRFPSFEFLEALQEQAKENPGVFESLKPADTYLALALGDYNFGVEIEGQECVGLARGVNLNDVDFTLSGSAETWSDKFENILENAGADDAHSLEALLESHDGLRLDGEPTVAREAYEAHADWLQAFFDLAQNLTIEFE